MTHPIGERNFVKQADSKEQMALDSLGPNSCSLVAGRSGHSAWSSAFFSSIS